MVCCATFVSPSAAVKISADARARARALRNAKTNNEASCSRLVFRTEKSARWTRYGLICLLWFVRGSSRQTIISHDRIAPRYYRMTFRRTVYINLRIINRYWRVPLVNDSCGYNSINFLAIQHTLPKPTANEREANAGDNECLNGEPIRRLLVPHSYFTFLS